MTLDLDVVTSSDAVDTFNFEVTFAGYQFGDASVERTEDQVRSVDLTSQIDAVAGAGNELGFGQELDVAFDDFDLSVTLNNSFSRSADIDSATQIVAGSNAGGRIVDTATNDPATFSAKGGGYDADVLAALNGLAYDATTGYGYNKEDGTLTLKVEETATGVFIHGVEGLDMGNGLGQATGYLATGAANDVKFKIETEDGGVTHFGDLRVMAATVATGEAKFQLQIGKGTFGTQQAEDGATTEFTYKIGTGNEDYDRITLEIDAVTTEALGVNGLDVTTAENADAASIALSTAIDGLNRARATIGAFQNRLEIASSNLATATENTEAARSGLLDLDVASEMTKFTSQQILVQAGVSMLAQANQLPQNLLRLLQ